MPELPEVQTISRRLAPLLSGRRILSVDLLWPRSLANLSEMDFVQRLTGQSILHLSRRGKFLQMHMTDDYLLFHLRMSGDLLVRDESQHQETHDRLLLHLTRDQYLAFNDTRKFGRIWLTSDPQDVLGNLGPEPLEKDFTPQVLQQRLAARHRQLKPLLLDQTFLAGLGNIYTDEALHIARLHPLRQSDSLDATDAERLWRGIRQVLRDGLLRNGASIDWAYRGGQFQNHFRVYGREGQACPVCGSIIKKLKVGQRGTHFCPGCQVEREG